MSHGEPPRAVAGVQTYRRRQAGGRVASPQPAARVARVRRRLRASHGMASRCRAPPQSRQAIATSTGLASVATLRHRVGIARVRDFNLKHRIL